MTTAESSDLCDPRFGVPTFASRWSEREHMLPSYHDDPTAYAQQLLDLVGQQSTRVPIPCMDGSIAALRTWRQSFEHHGVAVALASEAALDTANDKQSTLAVAAEHGIPRPRTVALNHLGDATTALADAEFPAVIKPTQSWVSNTGLATRVISRTVINRAEALDFLQELNDAGSSSAIIQQMATGAREAVSLFYAQERVWASFAQVAHRTTPVLGGVSVVRESIPMPLDLLSASETLVRALNLEGYSEIEFRRDAKGRPLLMEINARLSGSLELAVRSGVPFPALAVAVGDARTPVSHTGLSDGGTNAVPEGRRQMVAGEYPEPRAAARVRATPRGHGGVRKGLPPSTDIRLHGQRRPRPRSRRSCRQRGSGATAAHRRPAGKSC